MVKNGVNKVVFIQNPRNFGKVVLQNAIKYYGSQSEKSK
jgi:hypothetical protein